MNKILDKMKSNNIFNEIVLSTSNINFWNIK